LSECRRAGRAAGEGRGDRDYSPGAVPGLVHGERVKTANRVGVHRDVVGGVGIGHTGRRRHGELVRHRARGASSHGGMKEVRDRAALGKARRRCNAARATGGAAAAAAGPAAAPRRPGELRWDGVGDGRTGRRAWAGVGHGDGVGDLGARGDCRRAVGHGDREIGVGDVARDRGLDQRAQKRGDVVARDLVVAVGDGASAGAGHVHGDGHRPGGGGGQGAQVAAHGAGAASGRGSTGGAGRVQRVEGGACRENVGEDDAVGAGRTAVLVGERVGERRAGVHRLWRSGGDREAGENGAERADVDVAIVTAQRAAGGDHHQLDLVSHRERGRPG